MAVNEPEAQPSFSIVDPRMTVEAMRDSGYKSTTHALARAHRQRDRERGDGN